MIVKMLQNIIEKQKYNNSAEACIEEKEEQITTCKSRLRSDSAQSILDYSGFLKQIIELRQHHKNFITTLSETISKHQR